MITVKKSKSARQINDWPFVRSAGGIEAVALVKSIKEKIIPLQSIMKHQILVHLDYVPNRQVIKSNLPYLTHLDSADVTVICMKKYC